MTAVPRVAPRGWFWGVIAVAGAVRLASARSFATAHNDEIWQYLEPAWHLVEGPWIVTWEQREGVRSWLLPVLLAGPMRLGHAIAPDGDLHLLLVRCTLALLSLTVPGAAWLLGVRLSALHGLIAGLVAATWFELVFFAPRALSDSVGLSLLLAGAGLLLASGHRHRYAVAGLVLGLSVAIRLQEAPAVVVLVLTATWRTRRTAWPPLIAGGLMAFAIDGAVDVALGHTPFGWVIVNVRENLVAGRARSFGTAPVQAYIVWLARDWGVAFVPLVVLAWRGARHYPPLGWAALAHLAVHSAIAHKEYRFLLPTIALLVILAAIGSADLLAAISPRRRGRATVAAMLCWIGASAALARHPAFFAWDERADMATALDRAGRAPAACGLALYRHDLGAAYVLYRRATPIDRIDDAATMARNQGAYDVIVTARAHGGEVPGPYVAAGCASDRWCVFRRPGPCAGSLPGGQPAGRSLNDWLIRRGL